MTPEAIANALGRATAKAGGGFMAQCPCHDDDKSSLSLDLSDTGKLLLMCFAGCDQRTVFNKLKSMGLLPQQPHTSVKPRIVAEYSYTNESGQMLYQAIRFEPKDFRQRRPDGNGGWIYNLKGVEPVLYNLPEVIDANDVVVVEGEKDVENLRKIGITATCNPLGALKWREPYNRHLAGKSVSILVDNDEPGRKHAQHVARSLSGIASEVKIVELPGLPPKGDVSDWLKVTGNGKQQLLEIIEQAPAWNPAQSEPLQDVFSSRPISEHGAACRLPERFTDTSIAQDLSDRLHGAVMYWREAGIWLFWDGQRWCSDLPGGLYPHIQQYVRAVMVEVAKADNIDADTRSKYLKALCQYEGHFKQTTLISALTVVPSLIAETRRLDADQMLLTCLNGTLDLTDGRLLAHRPDHNITRICRADYVHGSNCPSFITFLNQIFNGDQELIGYIKRLVGYCLTGRTDEQIMVFFYGTGRNGKTTLIRVLLMLLADFACSAQADILMLKNREGANNELARLRGARLVAVNEVEEGSRLAEAQLKTLTGGDTVTARFLFKEYFEYEPQFKMILVGNHKPQVRGRDLGIWRRIHLIPFTVTIPEENIDPHLPDKLRAELSGILAWAVGGCIEWQRDGLRPPASIRAATEQYRQGEDVFDQWLREYCVTGYEYKTPANDLLDSFKSASGWKHMTPNKMGRLLSDAGFEKVKSGERSWLGIGLISNTEQLDDQEEIPKIFRRHKQHS